MPASRCAIVLLVQRFAHAAAVVFREGALHHELNLPVDERRAALSGGSDLEQEIKMRQLHGSGQ